jgi:hypothetical protein
VYATNGPYLGARADVPYWRIDVHPNEFSMNYILVGNTVDDPPSGSYKPPANLTNQIAVGLVVSLLLRTTKFKPCTLETLEFVYIRSFLDYSY